ncbi:MAG: tRNA pseudouridine(38-40) synthase TruA [Gammaproteobacteria bacterium]|nr:tRNA pseudouridine(38-40) synthase TruA [Gammaproteobacteria bacterium]
MGQRIALTVEYNGAAYNGWQLQQGANVATVQGVLEAALGAVAARPVRLFCAGRTDSGVHATNQLVHFDAPTARSPKAWLMGSNANLPDSVVVKGVQAVPAEFHARFSARSRRYRYLILNTAVRSALAPAQLTWVRYPLDVALMHGEAQSLLGERDFSAFRAASCQSTTAMRHVDFVEVYRHGELVVVDIQANAFLHHMVRNIVGTLLAVGCGQLAAGELAGLLALRDRTLAPETAPANGLYLVGVSYPAQFSLQSFPPGPVFLLPDPD